MPGLSMPCVRTRQSIIDWPVMCHIETDSLLYGRIPSCSHRALLITQLFHPGSTPSPPHISIMYLHNSIAAFCDDPACPCHARQEETALLMRLVASGQLRICQITNVVCATGSEFVVRTSTVLHSLSDTASERN
jgi:hypothetical protein